MAFLSNIGKTGDVAERSPAVISANLKEDMLLQKKLVVLNRSERSVVHQLKVDQKVLYKRFQAKLIRSKLASARLMGQRDVMRELRASSLGGLNTDIAGNSEEDYTFLKMLEQRPCTATSMSPRLTEPMSKLKSAGKKRVAGDAKDDKVEESITKPSGRSVSARARYHRQLADNFDIENGACKSREEVDIDNVKVRPATSSGARVDEEFLKHQNQTRAADGKELEPSANMDYLSTAIENKTDKVDGTQNDKYSDDETSSDKSNLTEQRGSVQEDSNIINDDQKANVDDQGSQDVNSPEMNAEVMDSPDAKKQSVAFMDETKDEGPKIPDIIKVTKETTGIDDTSPSTPISPRQLSRKTNRGADFFSEEKKIDLVSLHLQRARSLDYSGHVQRFCEELEEMKGCEKQPRVDYYAMRLQLSQEQSVSKPLTQVPGTPEEEYRRSMGNLMVRSLTVPEVNWNFED